MRAIGTLTAAFLVTAFVANETHAADRSNEPFVAKPYLQLGQATAADTMVVMWHGADADEEWNVEARTKGVEVWRKADKLESRRVAVNAKGLEPFRIYHATLSGLKPGETFEYKVSRGENVEFVAEGKARKGPDQPYRFVAFGDCGAGSKEQSPLALRAYKAKPDMAVIPGDIVYEYGLLRDYREKFWPVYNADAPSESGGVPLLRSTLFVAAPGNHDLDMRDLNRYGDGLAYFSVWDQPLNGPLGIEKGPFVPELGASPEARRAFENAAGPAYPRMANFSFDYGNSHWTIIDSNPYVDWTDRTVKEWVASDLAAAKGATWRFVMFHHPAFQSAREHFEQQHMRLLAPIFEAGKVDVVISGHVHNYQRTYPMKFAPDKQGTLLVGGKDGKTWRGRVVNGRWSLDRTFDGQRDTTPDGIIYLVTGVGGQRLYNPEQNDDPDSWQKFTDRFVSNVHSLTIADVDGPTLHLSQVTADGQVVDRITVTKSTSAASVPTRAAALSR